MFGQGLRLRVILLLLVALQVVLRTCLISKAGGWSGRISNNDGDKHRDENPSKKEDLRDQVSPLPPINNDYKRDDVDPCEGYKGVLRIRQGDEGAAAGTVFFVYVVNHLIYAQEHNLLPWVYLDDTSEKIYDPVVHGNETHRSFQMRVGDIPDLPEDPKWKCPSHPGTPSGRGAQKTITVSGNGVWNTYFEPLVPSFDPFKKPCYGNATLYYDLDIEQVASGIHLCAHWAVRTWFYGYVPSPTDLNISMEEWYRPMRQRASELVQKYFHVKPWLQAKIDQANPLKQQVCMAMHIRTTDKPLSGGRDMVPLDQYLPHALIFISKVKKEGKKEPIIYIATDSQQVIRDISEQWPLNSSFFRMQSNIVRSNGTEYDNGEQPPPFELVGSHHHISNTEVLVDIYAMAKCVIMVHGRSAVSEAVLYINPRMEHIDLEGSEDY